MILPAMTTAPVQNRSGRSYATPTYNLALTGADWLAEWDHDRNPAGPDTYTPRSNRRVWWRCRTCGWGWQASPDVRTRGHGCPACAGQVATPDHNLALDAPDWLTEWDHDRNGADRVTPADLLPRSNRRVWWRCPTNPAHVYDASPAARQRGAGCPYCAGRRVDDTNSLAALAPAVAASWHPTRNGDLTPADVTIGTSRRIWWTCSGGHEWEAPVRSRTTVGAGCPVCAGKVPGLHNRLDLHADPAVLADWHPTRNGDLTPRALTVGSNQAVWWQCGECAYEWQARVIDRTGNRPTGCPRCAPVTRSRTEIAIACELAWLWPDHITPDQPTVLDLGEPRPTSVDVLHAGARVVVEYDGSYTHASDAHADRDARKTRLLQQHGYRVIRIRATTLPPLPDDIPVAVEVVGDTKATVNNVIVALADLGWVTSPHADAYLQRAYCTDSTRADLIWATLTDSERFTPRASRWRQARESLLAGHYDTLF